MRSPMARSSSGFLLPETGLCADAPVTQGRARPRLRSLGAILFAAGLLMPVARAFALWDDKLQLFAEEKVTHDGNIFRISKDLDPEGDTYRTTSLGFNLDAPVSRQRFQMGYTWNATRYIDSPISTPTATTRGRSGCGSSATTQAASLGIRKPPHWHHLRSHKAGPPIASRHSKPSSMLPIWLHRAGGSRRG